MKLSKLLLPAIVLLTSFPANLPAAESPAASRPNIILLMADDLGWGDPGFNGNTVIKTPHLDAMAKGGLRFDRFYSGAPVCSPTRGTVLTGRHPYRYGIWTANEGHLRKQEISLPEILKAQGYTTGHYGKWHLGTLNPNFSGKGAGRDAAKNFMTPAMKGSDDWFATEYGVRLWDPFTDAAANPYYHNGKLETENLAGDDSRVLMDRAIPFIRKAAAAKTPFLAVIWFHAPHEPVVAGPEYLKMYPGLSEGEQHYYGCITALDEQVGRLRKELRDLGVADNTLVWFTSDNGPEGNTGDAGRQRDVSRARVFLFRGRRIVEPFGRGTHCARDPRTRATRPDRARQRAGHAAPGRPGSDAPDQPIRPSSAPTTARHSWGSRAAPPAPGAGPAAHASARCCPGRHRPVRWRG